MKPLHYIVIGIFLVTTGIYVYSRYIEPVPNHPLTPDQEKGYALLQAAKGICLSGESQSLNASIDGLLNTKEAKISSGIQDKTLRGAITYVDDEIRAVQDTEIRACLRQHWPKIEACLLGDCTAANLPANITFQFNYEFEDEADTTLDDSLVRLAIQNRRSTMLVRQPPENFYPYNVGLPPVGTILNARIHRVVKEGFSSSHDHATKLCLMRAATLPAGPNPPTHTRYHCWQEEGRCEHDTLSPRWFDQCTAASNKTSLAPQNQSSMLSDFFTVSSAAFAQNTVSEVWHVPSLETLQARADVFGQGYTQFTIASKMPANVDADGYFVSLTVNGQAVHIDGMPPSFMTEPLKAGANIDFNFALQNLNFSGVDAGCDTITAALQFVKNGKLVGEPVRFRRSYVALRDARVKTMQWGDNTLTWTGKFVRAPRQYDNEFFAQSIVIPGGLSKLKNTAKIARAQASITEMKARFDNLNLKFAGNRLVAVIRPPLTQTSYGLAVGMVEPTGQIRFTFKYTEAKELRDQIMDQRSDPRIRRAVDKGAFIYSVRGNEAFMKSPAVCRDDTALLVG